MAESVNQVGTFKRPAKVRTHRDLEVYQRAFAVSMRLFEWSKKFPREETYSLTDQVRRSSRSVSANIAEAWRKRRYGPAFVAKLTDAESEAAETQVWIEYAVRCDYTPRNDGADAYREYDRVIATLVGMIRNVDRWIISDSSPAVRRAGRTGPAAAP